MRPPPTPDTPHLPDRLKQESARRHGRAAVAGQPGTQLQKPLRAARDVCAVLVSEGCQLRQPCGLVVWLGWPHHKPAIAY